MLTPLNTSNKAKWFAKMVTYPTKGVGIAMRIHPMIHPRTMNSLLLGLVPCLLLHFAVANDVAPTDNVEARWKLQYVAKNVDGSKYPLFPWEKYSQVCAIFY